MMAASDSAEGCSSDGEGTPGTGWDTMHRPGELPTEGFVSDCLSRRQALVRGHGARVEEMVTRRPAVPPEGTKMFFDGMTGQCAIITPNEVAGLVASVQQMIDDGESQECAVEMLSKMPMVTGIEAQGPLVMVHCNHSECFNAEAQTAVVGSDDALINTSLWLWANDQAGGALDLGRRDIAQTVTAAGRCWEQRAQWAVAVGSSKPRSSERVAVLAEIERAIADGDMAELGVSPPRIRCNHMECVADGSDSFALPDLWQSQ